MEVLGKILLFAFFVLALPTGLLWGAHWAVTRLRGRVRGDGAVPDLDCDLVRAGLHRGAFVCGRGGLMSRILNFMLSDNWLERRVFAPLFEDMTVTLPRAVWGMIALAAAFGWVIW